MGNRKPKAPFLSHLGTSLCSWYILCFLILSQFLSLPPHGVRKPRDLSLISSPQSDHVKNFNSSLQGLKPHWGKGTRNSCGHQEGFLAVQRGHRVPWHNPGSTAKNCTGLTRLNSRRQLSGASWEGCYIMSFQDKLWTSWRRSGLAFLQASTNQLAGDSRLTLCTYLLQTKEVGRNVKTWSKPFLWLSSVQGCFRNAYL